jgi:hypothetical protein
VNPYDPPKGELLPKPPLSNGRVACIWGGSIFAVLFLASAISVYYDKDNPRAAAVYLMIAVIWTLVACYGGKKRSAPSEPQRGEVEPKQPKHSAWKVRPLILIIALFALVLVGGAALAFWLLTD